MAHIAMMEDEAVVRRHWLTRERFLDLVAIANILPGPSSSEIAIYLGYVRAGWPGLVLGGTCFIVPAALLVTAIAWTYTRFGTVPQTAGVFSSIRAVVVAILLQALWRLGRAAIRDRFSLVVAVSAAALSLAGLAPLTVLAVAGSAVAMARRMRPAGIAGAPTLLPFPSAKRARRDLSHVVTVSEAAGSRRAARTLRRLRLPPDLRPLAFTRLRAQGNSLATDPWCGYELDR